MGFMRNSWLFYIISALSWLWPFVAPAQTTTIQGEIPSITVLADRALTVPLSQIASQYSRKHHLSITVNFAPSFEQTVAIEEGEPADIFISAHPAALEKLKQQGLFDVYSITPIVKSRMALISSVDDTGRPEKIDFTLLKRLRNQPDFLLAVANPAATAEGYYTEQILEHITSELFLSGSTAMLQNTDDILRFMRGTPAYGITFVPYALQDETTRYVGNFPENWHEPIMFTGVVIAGGQMENARKFLQHLKTAEAQRNFIKYRFYGVNTRRN